MKTEMEEDVLFRFRETVKMYSIREYVLRRDFRQAKISTRALRAKTSENGVSRKRLPKFWQTFTIKTILNQSPSPTKI